MSDTAKRILVIGAGWAGTRFIRSITYMGETRGPAVLAGVCDRDPAKLAALPREGIQVGRNVADMLTKVRPDAVCVCVNETAHFDVLRQLSEHEFAPHILMCEKPLTATLEEAIELSRVLKTKQLTVNFVERQSPAVKAFRQWFARQDLQPRRVEFLWGKCRVNDPRPTIGDATEVVHPLDLIRYLLGLPSSISVDVLSAVGTDSDFSWCGQLPDSLDLQLRMGETLIVGHSSFVWDERYRRVIVYATDLAGDIYQASLILDSPRWDDDSFTVRRIEADGTATQLWQRSFHRSDVLGPLRGISKVHQFVARSCASPPGEELVDLNGALWAQRTLASVLEHAEKYGRPSVHLKGATGRSQLAQALFPVSEVSEMKGASCVRG